MTPRRVIYVMEPFPFPSGGVATVYRHVEFLNDRGIEAFVALSTRPTVDFYGSRAALLVHGGKLPLMRGDVVVFPEGFSPHVAALMSARIRRLMFCQSQYYVPFSEDPGRGIAEFGVHGIIASSESVREFFRDVYGIADVPLVPYAIDPARFAPAPSKRRQIAYMPRKLAADAAFILGTFRRRHRRHANVPWLAIDNVPQREAARLMGESEVFLSLSSRESFGLPPLEAMACGCLVAGYHGDGGREYMTAENGWWADAEDWHGCVDGLAAALDLLESGGSALAARRAAMAETVARYSPPRMQEALLAFWREELARPLPEDVPH